MDFCITALDSVPLINLSISVPIEMYIILVSKTNLPTFSWFFRIVFILTYKLYNQSVKFSIKNLRFWLEFLMSPVSVDGQHCSPFVTGEGSPVPVGNFNLRLPRQPWLRSMLQGTPWQDRSWKEIHRDMNVCGVCTCAYVRACRHPRWIQARDQSVKTRWSSSHQQSYTWGRGGGLVFF